MKFPATGRKDSYTGKANSSNYPPFFLQQILSPDLCLGKVIGFSFLLSWTGLQVVDKGPCSLVRKLSDQQVKWEMRQNVPPCTKEKTLFFNLH